MGVKLDVRTPELREEGGKEGREGCGRGLSIERERKREDSQVTHTHIPTHTQSSSFFEVEYSSLFLIPRRNSSTKP
jgi:hypothetical protein